jgi:catechol 2,3-dioxygenase-like lactoylglutathione lyase family enzyme
MEEKDDEGQLRHIALSVPDKDKAAKFYEETFGSPNTKDAEGAPKTREMVL